MSLQRPQELLARVLFEQGRLVTKLKVPGTLDLSFEERNRGECVLSRRKNVVC